MRSIEEQSFALECLRLASAPEKPARDVVRDAGFFHAFVTGKDVDDAKRKLDAVSEVIRS